VKRRQSLAIVLRRWPYSENSLVIHALTPEEGVLSMLAKGVNKLNSGKIGVLDTYAMVRVSYGAREGQEMYNLYSTELVDRFAGLSSDVDRLSAAALLAELAELAAPTGSPSQQVFIFLTQTFEELARVESIDPFLIRKLIEALDLLGLKPDFGSFPYPSNGGSSWFSLATGRILAPGSQRPDGQSFRLSWSLLEALGLAQNCPEKLEQLTRPELENCLTILGEFLGYHLERPPRAWQVLQERRLPAQNSR
jgi:recombinational DNA repair protein (RecF pathway)